MCTGSLFPLDYIWMICTFLRCVFYKQDGLASSFLIQCENTCLSVWLFRSFMLYLKWVVNVSSGHVFSVCPIPSTLLCFDSFLLLVSVPSAVQSVLLPSSSWTTQGTQRRKASWWGRADSYLGWSASDLIHQASPHLGHKNLPCYIFCLWYRTVLPATLPRRKISVHFVSSNLNHRQKISGGKTKLTRGSETCRIMKKDMPPMSLASQKEKRKDMELKKCLKKWCLKTS